MTAVIGCAELRTMDHGSVPHLVKAWSGLAAATCDKQSVRGYGLTLRELQIVESIVAGFTNKGIAQNSPSASRPSSTTSRTSLTSSACPTGWSLHPLPSTTACFPTVRQSQPAWLGVFCGGFDVGDQRPKSLVGGVPALKMVELRLGEGGRPKAVVQGISLGVINQPR